MDGSIRRVCMWPAVSASLMICLCSPYLSAQQFTGGQRQSTPEALPPALVEPVRVGSQNEPLEPPPLMEVFRASSEANFINRMRSQARERDEPFATPQTSPRTEEVTLYEPPPMAAVFAAREVCHCPLYFEQWHTERDGWRIPVGHP